VGGGEVGEMRSERGDVEQCMECGMSMIIHRTSKGDKRIPWHGSGGPGIGVILNGG